MRRLHELRPNLWTLDVILPECRVRSVVVVGDKAAAVWDSLTHPADMQALAETLGSRPFHLIYSHADWDHIWGTAGFARAPLNIIAHQDCARRFARDVPQTLRKMRAAAPGRWDAVRLMPPTLCFRSELTLDLGGLRLQLQHLPGHTRDGIIGWIPEWGVLLGGDAIETPLPLLNETDSLPGWLAALEGWAAEPALKRAIPAHGTVDGRESLDRTVAYLRALLAGDDDFDLPALDDFYAAAHRANRRIARGLGG